MDLNNLRTVQGLHAFVNGNFAHGMRRVIPAAPDFQQEWQRLLSEKSESRGPGLAQSTPLMRDVVKASDRNFRETSRFSVDYDEVWAIAWQACEKSGDDYNQAGFRLRGQGHFVMHIEWYAFGNQQSGFLFDVTEPWLNFDLDGMQQNLPTATYLLAAASNWQEKQTTLMRKGLSLPDEKELLISYLNLREVFEPNPSSYGNHQSFEYFPQHIMAEAHLTGILQQCPQRPGKAA